eukprot:1144593-Pelagomonas_calceolata.AAC.4
MQILQHDTKHVHPCSRVFESKVDQTFHRHEAKIGTRSTIKQHSRGSDCGQRSSGTDLIFDFQENSKRWSGACERKGASNLPPIPMKLQMGLAVQQAQSLSQRHRAKAAGFGASWNKQPKSLSDMIQSLPDFSQAIILSSCHLSPGLMEGHYAKSCIEAAPCLISHD